MILLLPLAVIAFLVLGWMLARVVSFVFGVLLALGKGLALAAAAGGMAALVASYGELDPAPVGVGVALIALPFTLGFAWRSRQEGRIAPPAARRSVRVPLAAESLPPTVAGLDPVWHRARDLAGRHGRRLSEAEQQVARFLTHAAREPLDPDVIDYSPMIELRLAQTVPDVLTSGVLRERRKAG